MGLALDTPSTPDSGSMTCCHGRKSDDVFDTANEADDDGKARCGASTAGHNHEVEFNSTQSHGVSVPVKCDVDTSKARARAHSRARDQLLSGAMLGCSLSELCETIDTAVTRLEQAMKNGGCQELVEAIVEAETAGIRKKEKILVCARRTLSHILREEACRATSQKQRL